MMIIIIMDIHEQEDPLLFSSSLINDDLQLVRTAFSLVRDPNQSR
jgi:hypothetical protein